MKTNPQVAFHAFAVNGRNMRTLLLTCLWLLATVCMAIPAKRTKRIITLTDGTQKEVVLTGDEHVHFFQDADGNAYQQNTDGTFVKVDKEELLSKWRTRLDSTNSARARKASARRAQWGATSNPVSGSKKSLVILANFSDKAMASSHTQSYFNNYFNQEGFSQDGMSGSVHDYFKESSYGKFDLTFDVVGPVTVSKSVKYYGENDRDGNDKHSGEFVTEVVKLADAKGVDFSKYDWDGDGKVDQVFIVYAGYAESNNAAAYTIWPHEFELESRKEYGDGNGAINLDGVTIDTYAVSSECLGTSGSTICGIGTACHEFSHCMCIPDMYDTEGSSFGMGDWDLMCSGSYNGGNDYDGTCPSGFTSYERMYCGWLTPTELSSPCNVTSLKSLAKNAQAYIIYNQANKNEFYMLENRQNEGFNSSDPAHGMLILHIDFDKTAWIDNVVNNTSNHQRITIIPADGKASYDNEAADTWPGTGKKTSFTDSTKPAATLYNANSDGRKFMGKPITNISESNGIISFTFDGGGSSSDPDTPVVPDTPTPPAAPVAKDATNITATSFVANWNAVSGATQYEIELTAMDKGNSGDSGNTGGSDDSGNTGGSDDSGSTGGNDDSGSTGGNDDSGNTSSIPAESILLSENFSGFNNGGSADGTQDVSKDVDSYMQTKGWESSKLFTTPNDEVKMGSRNTPGELLTPFMTSNKGNVTIVIEGRSYDANGTSMDIYYSAGNNEAKLNGSVNFSNNSTVQSYTLKAGKNFWLALSPEARFYMSQLYVIDGNGYTNDQLSSLFKSAKNIAANTTVVRRASQTSTYKTASTSYSFTNLSADKAYSYRVRAIADGVTGNWSNSIKIELPTAIQTVMQGATSDVIIYDLLGRRVSEMRKGGIYIVNGKKVVR